MLAVRVQGSDVDSESGAVAFDFVPPHAPQAEAALLGSLILRPEGLKAATLEPNDFYADRNRIVYAAICRLSSVGTAIDAVTLAEELERTQELDDAGGVGRLLEIMNSVPHAEHLAHYAGQVRDAAARRRVVIRASEALRLALNGSEPERLAAELDAARAALAISDGSTVIRCLADVPAERLEWLWPGRIPLGKLTLLAGDPGLGKSFLTLDLAARVTSGRGWPDGEGGDGAGESERGGDDTLAGGVATSASQPADVILFGAEDDLADTVRPRLDAAGADVSRIAAIEGVRGTAGPRGFSLVSDLPRLEAVLAARPDTRLVVIDPITAYCSGVDSHKNADVRALLAPLAELAARRRVAVVAVTHLNKAAGGKAIYRAMGSLAYIAAARVGWLVAKDQNDPERRLMLPVKNNLASDAGGLAYRLEEGRVVWETGRIDLDADEALGSGKDGGKTGGSTREDGVSPARRLRADVFLEERLADGPVPASVILDDAVGTGLTYDQIKKARKRVGVHSERQGDGWVLRLDPDRPRDLASANAELFDDPFAGR